MIQADDVDDLRDELRVGGELEGILQVRLEIELLPDPPDGGLRQPGAGRHGGTRPVRVLARSGFQRRDDNVLDLVEQDGRRPPRPRLVGQTLQPPLDEPGPPAVHRLLTHPEFGRHLLVRPALRTPQHDPRAQGQELRGLRPSRPTRQLSPLGITEHQLRLAPARSRLIRKSGHPPGSKP